MLKHTHADNTNNVELLPLSLYSHVNPGTYSKVDGSGGSNGARMRFDPEASWGANAGLDIPRKALENVKVCVSSHLHTNTAPSPAVYSIGNNVE
jgi:hypothetical protein